MNTAITCLAFMASSFSMQKLNAQQAERLEADFKELSQRLAQGDKETLRIIQTFLKQFITIANKKKQLADFEQAHDEILQKLLTIKQGFKNGKTKTKLQNLPTN